MNKIYYKDVRKNITKKVVSWISVVVIIMISVTAYLCTSFISTALGKSAAKYYKETNFRDFEMISSLGVTSGGITIMKGVKGVKDVEGEISMGAVVEVDGEKMPLKLLSLTERINKPKVIEGKLPTEKGQMLMDADTMEKNGLKIGDTVKVSTEKGGVNALLKIKSTSFTIVGSCFTADKTTRGKKDSAVILPDEFSSDLIDEPFYTGALVTVEDTGVSDIFSDKYFEKISEIEDDLRKMSDVLANDHLATLNRVIGEKKEAVRTFIEDIAKVITENYDVDSEKLQAYIDDNIDDLIDKVFNSFDSLGKSKWVVLNRKLNEGFPEIQHAKKAIEIMGTYFTPLFLVIAALVIFFTVTIMINEQSRLIGAQKALGFKKKEIRRKYLIFGLSAAVFGVILGIGGGLLLEVIVLRMFTSLYSFGRAETIFDPVKLLIILSGVLILTAFVIMLACKRLLKCSPTGLMSGVEPQTRSRTKSSKHKFGSLYSRLILRNMKTEIGRVIVSIVIIMGGTMLIGTGFTVFMSFKSFILKQQQAVEVYSFKLDYENVSSEKTKAEMFKVLDENGASYITALDKIGFYRASDKVDMGELLVLGKEDVDEFLRFRKMNGRDKAVLEDEGVIVQNRIMEKSGIKDGYNITVYNGKLDRATVKVNGTFINYIGSLIVMTDEAYKKAYGTEPVHNTIYVNVPEDKLKGLADTLLGLDESISIKYPDYYLPMLNSFIKLFDLLVIILCGLAILIVFMVLTNLSNIFVAGKMKELLIMKANGFSSGQVTGYLLRETVVTTVLGLLLGTGLGIPFAAMIVRMIESDKMTMIRSPFALAWVIAVCAGTLFSVVINGYAFRKTRKINVIDITRY